MSLGSHQATIGKTQTWITPRWIIDALGPFDLDPCAADPRPWDCAFSNWPTDGLNGKWRGRVWLNPPFHRYQVLDWVQRLAEHGDGIALLHARTEAEWFEPVWAHASAILFLADRLYFHYPDGRRSPAVLCAFGFLNGERLACSGIKGYLVRKWDSI